MLSININAKFTAKYSGQGIFFPDFHKCFEKYEDILNKSLKKQNNNKYNYLQYLHHDV